MKKDNLIIASKLLADFTNYLNKRSTSFLMRPDGMLINILEWHFRVWEKEHEYLNVEGKLEEWGLYSEILRTIGSIFNQVEKRALQEGPSYSFFKKIESHVGKYKKESISSSFYVESLLGNFYQVFFQHIYNSRERFNIWNHYFPIEWKVTKSNLQNLENIISKISLNNFLEWSTGRIWQATNENDYSLDDVSSNLFPELDPILWARILIFVFSPYGENRLRSVVERPWNFGFMSRVRIYHDSQEEKIKRIYKDEEYNTFDMSYYLFKDQFSKTNLVSYIKSLEELSYSKESIEESKRLTLHSIFKKMLKLLNNTAPSDLSKQ